MRNSMQITPMTPETASLVAALEADCFSTPWSLQSIRSELENEWARWLVALDGDRLMGYIGIQFGPDGGDIMTIATAPEYRCHGVGRALLAEAIRWLRQKDLEWLTLEVRPSNQPALALYRALSFREVGRRPGYYKKPPEDALLMTLFFKEESHADSRN
jgi:ribosomal-protein-alanine N-acetyltransferase